MSIFGLTCPKFVYDEGGSFQQTVTLTYGLVTSNETQADYIEHVSEIDGERDFIPRGSHRRVEILYHLYKHGTAAARTYTRLNKFVGAKVSLYLHSDGVRFEKSPGQVALFVLKEVQAFYLETSTYKDGLTLIFESCDPVEVDLADQDTTWNWLWGNTNQTFADVGALLISDCP